MLANIIIHKEFEIFETNVKIKISTERFNAIVNEIKLLFPGENDVIYYVPYNRLTGQRACGKLWDCYNYLKRKLYTNNDTPITAPDKELEKKLNFLAVNCNDVHTIEQYWRDTRNYRYHYLETNITDNINAYFEKFCILNTITGLKLLVEDFQCRFPANKINLSDVWPEINAALIKFGETKTNKDIQVLLTNPHILTGFLILTQILSNSAYKRVGTSNKRTKLTKLEVLQSFLCLVPVRNFYILLNCMIIFLN